MAEANGDLIIGIGNTLRGDDGVGWWLAERATALQPAAKVMTVQQLTPELCEALAAVQRVLFIDAWLAPQDEVATVRGLCSVDRRHPQPRLQRLPSPSDPPVGAVPKVAAVHSHGLDPPQLLAITALLQGAAPAAWLLLVPAFALGHGEGFSPALQAGLPRAEALLEAWC